MQLVVRAVQRVLIRDQPDHTPHVWDVPRVSTVLQLVARHVHLVLEVHTPVLVLPIAHHVLQGTTVLAEVNQQLKMIVRTRL